MKRILVTGLDGFVGRVVQNMIERREADARFKLVVPSMTIELLDPASLARAIEETQPDLVLHLAAQSFVPSSISDPRATYNVNFFGTLNLLEALKACGFPGRMLYISSGDVYGLVAPDALPIAETHAVRPRNPYAVSKAAAELLCYQWTQSHAFEIVLARPFNHVGPGQAEWFVVPDFAKQVVEVKLGLREPVIRVGAIDVTRDFTDVRDVVRAYFLLLERGKKGEAYNICTGREQSIREILERLIVIAGIDCQIVQDEARFRPNEQKRIYGSFAKLNEQVGWQPTIDIDKSLQDVLSYWESKLKHA
jgi:GDP-4-dehydro-6-deoxy-D-mannose reductase